MMDRKNMLHILEERAEAYRAAHPSTSEMDMDIFRAYCSGKNAVQISMNIPCAESTVYRAIRRVKDFLRTPELSPFVDILRAHIANVEPCNESWNAHSVLELLYVSYSDYKKSRPEQSQYDSLELRQLLDEAPPDNAERIYDAVCNLCNYFERSGFSEGLKLGVRLVDELK